MLFACFDFFRDEEKCLSKEAYELLSKNGKYPSRLLPVSWEKIDDAVAKLTKEDFDALVILGNGRGETHKIEKLAVNAQGTNILDNSDVRCQGDLIAHDGKAAYFSTWDVEKLSTAMAKEGLPTQISYFSGLFLCNGAYYRALRNESQKLERRPIVLLHLSPERNISSDLPKILQALEISLNRTILL